MKIVVAIRMTLVKGDDRRTVFIRSGDPTVVLLGTDVDSIFINIYEKLMESLARWTSQGSGFTIEKIEKLHLDVAKYRPIRGATYKELPAWVKKKNAIVNVKNKDNECFRWAIRSALYPASKNPDRTSKYPTDDLVWDGIQFPVALKQITKFEEMNNKSINVYGIRDETIVPFRISDGASFINLLYYEGHYSWIKHTSRLFYGQSKHKAKKFFCERCLHTFAKEETLIAHRSDCAGISKTACRIEMPKDTFKSSRTSRSSYLRLM